MTLAALTLLAACNGDHVIGALAGGGGSSNGPTADAGAANSATPPDAGSGAPTLQITSVSSDGTGCPAGTATVHIASDGRSFDVTYPATFAVQYDASAPATAWSTSCQLTVRFNGPAGYVYLLQSIDYAGKISLVDGARAQLTTTYHSDSEPDPIESDIPFTGPTVQAVQTQALFNSASMVLAGCGATSQLIIDSTLSVSQGSAPQTSHGELSVAHASAFQIQLLPCQR